MLNGAPACTDVSARAGGKFLLAVCLPVLSAFSEAMMYFRFLAVSSPPPPRSLYNIRFLSEVLPAERNQ